MAAVKITKNMKLRIFLILLLTDLVLGDVYVEHQLCINKFLTETD